MSLLNGREVDGHSRSSRGDLDGGKSELRVWLVNAGPESPQCPATLRLEHH